MADPDALHDDEPEGEILLIPPQMLQVINSNGVIRFESYAHAQDKMEVDLAALQQLVQQGVSVARFERVELSLGELIQRVITRKAGGRRE